MARLLQKKANKQVIAATTRQAIPFHVGDRSPHETGDLIRRSTLNARSTEKADSDLIRIPPETNRSQKDRTQGESDEIGA